MKSSKGSDKKIMKESRQKRKVKDGEKIYSKKIYKRKRQVSQGMNKFAKG